MRPRTVRTSGIAIRSTYDDESVIDDLRVIARILTGEPVTSDSTTPSGPSYG